MSTKKIFPKFKKSVTQFISEEDGFVTKAQVTKVIVGAAMIGALTNIPNTTYAGHTNITTNYTYGVYSGHVNAPAIDQPISGKMDRKANGHVNGIPPTGHLNAAAVNKPGYAQVHANSHVSHGSHGSCGGGHW